MTTKRRSDPGLDGIRVLKPSELESLKGGAPPGPEAPEAPTVPATPAPAWKPRG